MSTAAPLWGIGQWEAPGGVRVTWEISQEEMDRDIGSATKAEADLGIAAGHRVLWCSMLSEAGQFWPLLVGTLLAGAQVSCTDATSAEASRLAMFCRLMEYRAVLGLNAALLDGLDELGLAYGDVLGNVGVVAARPDACERLQAAGLAPHPFVLAGPAVAIAREPGGPAPLDGDEWRAEEADGAVAVTSLRRRAMPLSRAPTAVRGRVVDGAIAIDPGPRR